MTNDLLAAVEASDAGKATGALSRELALGKDPWAIHQGLFSVVQRVLNPPFINPHLPKMYRIVRELKEYLKPENVPALVRLEVNEYARRPKLDDLPRAALPVSPSPVPFGEIESAIANKDAQKAANLMAWFLAHEGGTQLARRLLLLGSCCLEGSLGHSVSCTAFILLEMLERKDQDPWPALVTLADYFCKGGFRVTPPLRTAAQAGSEEMVARHLLRAASGRGIVNLHHTITLYAIERVRHLFGKEEHDHMIASWIAFMGDKEPQGIGLDEGRMTPPSDYDRFYEIFCELDARSVTASLTGLLGTEEGRRRLGRFLIKAVCDQYRGDYNPHYLTGLGSALWVVERFWRDTPVATSALFQYVDFFFEGTRR